MSISNQQVNLNNYLSLKNKLSKKDFVRSLKSILFVMGLLIALFVGQTSLLSIVTDKRVRT